MMKTPRDILDPCTIAAATRHARLLRSQAAHAMVRAAIRDIGALFSAPAALSRPRIEPRQG